MSPGSDMQSWFEAVWADREDRVYRERFGDLGGGVFAAGDAPFGRMKQEPAHPGWRHHGVFLCPPHGDRQAWLSVTSGLSNPWNLEAPGRDPSGYSGVGFELCLLSPERADWAVQLLHNLMAWQLLVSAGAVSGQPLDKGQRVPLGGSVTGTRETPLAWVLVETPEIFEPSFELASGRVDFLLLVGVTEPEVQWARVRDQEALVRRLGERGVWPVTDPARGGVV